MGEEQDLNPEISGVFFESKVLKIDQSCLTENGMEYVFSFLNFDQLIANNPIYIQRIPYTANCYRNLETVFSFNLFVNIEIFSVRFLLPMFCVTMYINHTFSR
jgi:hypothetical protein